MIPVTWSTGAISDLERLGTRAAEFSPEARRRFHEQITAAVDRLALFPHSGRMVPEHGEIRFRETLAPPYRVLYLVEPGEVHIVAVIHGAMDLTPEPGE